MNHFVRDAMELRPEGTAEAGGGFTLGATKPFYSGIMKVVFSAEPGYRF